MAPRARLLPLLLVAAAVVLAQPGGTSCETLRLRGSVVCLDCAPGHDLSGVVVAMKCRGAGADKGQLHAAQTDGRGDFEVAVVAAAPASRSRCAARVLGGPEQLCAQQRLAVARVVDAGQGSGAGYALGSHLAVFTRCGALATMAAAGGGQRSSPPMRPTTAPSPPQQQTPAGRSPPRAGGSSSPPYDLGLPLIYFFPFIPIIGIP